MLPDNGDQEMNKTVEFKSDTPYYYKEQGSLKTNTIRKIDMADDRFIILRKMKDNNDYGMIKIIHRQLPEESFIRNISDITEWDKCYLISWKSVKKRWKMQ